MVFSRFIWTVFALVALIVVTAAGLGIYLQKPDYPFTVSVLVLLLVLEAAALFYYLVRIRSDLIRLVNALRHEDTTLSFKKHARDPYFSAIHRGFNEIIRDFRLIRLDREAEHQFFRETVDHIQFGLIAFNEQGQVEFVNQAFLELFRMEKFSHIDALAEVTAGLPELFRELSTRQESLKQVQIEGAIHHLIFLASRFRLMDEDIALISVRDISREMDRNELEAWQKLLRVLRHEILNSITPIKLLASNLSGILNAEGNGLSLGGLTEKESKDIRTGLETIHRRATGLSNFLDAYTTLFRMPELHVRPVPVRAMLDRVLSLYSDPSVNEVEVAIECPEGEFSLPLDERLVEQVLINLLRNSLDAVREKKRPSILIYSRSGADRVVIGVRDNGTGINPDQLESIFIPFYTTKEGGSGIGLSFSQHVMRLHNGQLKVSSVPGKGSDFQLVFPRA